MCLQVDLDDFGDFPNALSLQLRQLESNPVSALMCGRVNLITILRGVYVEESTLLDSGGKVHPHS